MRRWLVGLALLVAALIALPPQWFRAFGAAPPALPPADRTIGLAAGTALSALDRGSGPPLVLVHGLPGCGHDWSPLVDALAERGHRVIAYDRAGYGRSDPRRAGAYTVDENARDLLALLESEDLRDATVVGWSYGGGTAIRAAILDPARIARLVLIGSAGPWADAPEDPALFAVLFSKPAMDWMGAVPPVARALQAAISAQAFAPEPVPPWWAAQLAANLGSPHTAHAYRQEGALFAWSEDLDPSPIDRPILVIHGAEDRLVPLQVGHGLHRSAREGRLAVVEGAGHMLPVTRPALLADQIAAFVAGG